MRHWIVALRKTVPVKLWIVSLPFVLILLVFGAWTVMPDRPEDPVLVRQRLAAEELASLLPRAEAGDVAAQYRAAVICRDGLTGKVDLARAVKWFTAASEAGHAESRYQLGKLYEKGLGVRQDYGRAAEWYRLAAGFANHAGAQFALAELYFHGRGVANDYGEALEWYLRAARQGHVTAQTIVATIYEKGWGVERDYTEAYYWYTLAAHRRARAGAMRLPTDPAKALAALIPKMSRLELERGNERLRKAGIKAKGRS